MINQEYSEDKGIRKPTDEFFGIWAKFLDDIQRARKASEEQALREKRKNSMPRRISTRVRAYETKSFSIKVILNSLRKKRNV